MGQNNNNWCMKRKTRILQGEKTVSAIIGAGKTGCSHTKELNKFPLLHHSQK